MAYPINPSAEDIKERQHRARQWKRFRRDYLYTQKTLAMALGCSERTVQSVESASEVLRPSVELLKRFRKLKAEMARLESEVA